MLAINQRVNRIEDREVTGATVITIEGDNIEIAYDEGGTGWWPAECLQPFSDD